MAPIGAVTEKTVRDEVRQPPDRCNVGKWRNWVKEATGSSPIPLGLVTALYMGQNLRASAAPHPPRVLP
jgi:hypothetical protein